MSETKNKKPQDRLAALRHLVYAHLLSALPPASYQDAATLIANLRLLQSLDTKTNRLDRQMSRLMNRFVWLKTTPDLAGKDQHTARQTIEIEFAAKYGARLADVAGFYFMQDRWRLNLPTRCLLHGYAGRLGFYNGILCQPIAHIDTYFLLSSAKFGGLKAIRLEERDRLFFESYKEPIAAGTSDAAELRQNATETEINELVTT